MGRKILIMALIFLLGGASGIAAFKLSGQSLGQEVEAQPVSKEEVYNTFQCPCCGQPIGSECCELAVERKAYSDGLIDGGLGKMEVMTRYVNRYSLDSFINEKEREEFRTYLIQKAPEERPQLEVFPSAVELGNVSIEGGVVETAFHLKNSGEEPLVVSGLSTSCGCTTASLSVKGVEGPSFGMDMGQEVKPSDWKAEIPPGEIALLKVHYDPSFHPELKGYVVREVYIESNDPIQPRAKVRIALNQVS